MAKEPILDLSTLAPDRPKIRIDGVIYEIAVNDDFGILDSHRLERLRLPMAAYADIETPTEANIEAMSDALKEFTAMVVRDATPELMAKLTENQKLSILRVFTNAAGWTEPEPSRPPRTRRSRRQTTDNLSQGSNGSMGETQSNG